MAFNLKVEDPDVTLPKTGFLQGADSQEAPRPSLYPIATVVGCILGASAMIDDVLVEDKKLIDHTVEWNNAAVPFTGWKLDIVDTASASSSKLLELQVNGENRFSVSKSGYVEITQHLTNALGLRVIAGGGGNVAYFGNSNSQITGGVGIGFTGGGATIRTTNTNLYVGVNGVGLLRLSGGSNVPILLDAASNIVEQRNSNNAQTFRIYNTYSDDVNFERANIGWSANEFVIETKQGGTGLSRPMKISAVGLTIESISNGVFNLNMNGNGAMNFKIADGAAITFERTNVTEGVTRKLITYKHASNQLEVYSTLNATTDHEIQLKTMGSYTKKFYIGAGTQAGGQRGTDVYVASGAPNGNGPNLRAGDMFMYAPASGGDGRNGYLILQHDGVAALPGGVGVGTSTPTAMLHLAQTWNDAAVAHNSLLIDITDTALDLASNAIDVKFGGSSYFSVSKGARLGRGIVDIDGHGETNRPAMRFYNLGLGTTGMTFGFIGGGSATLYNGTNPPGGGAGIGIGTTNRPLWIGVSGSAYGNALASLTISAAPNGGMHYSATTAVIMGNGIITDFLTLRDVSSPHEKFATFRRREWYLFNMWTDDTNYERGFIKFDSSVLQIGTEAGGTGASRDLGFATSGTLRWRLSGGDLLANVDATYDIGGNADNRPRNIYAATVIAGPLRMRGTAPASAAASGNTGDVRFDDDYVYVCTAPNAWKRAAIETW